MPCIFHKFYPKKNTVKYGSQIEFMTKHSMFSVKVYPSPEIFTRPLVAMVMTLCMSDTYQRTYTAVVVVAGRYFSFLILDGYFLQGEEMKEKTLKSFN